MGRCLKPVARRVGVALTQSWGGGDAVGNGRPVCLLQRQSSWLGPTHFPEEQHFWANLTRDADALFAWHRVYIALVLVSALRIRSMMVSFRDYCDEER